MKENSKDNESQLEIKFGMVFAQWYKKKCSLYVVVDVGQNDWFEASEIMIRKGKFVAGLPGTSRREDIDLVLGEITKEKILEGFDNLFEEPTSKIIVDTINKNATKSSRII